MLSGLKSCARFCPKHGSRNRLSRMAYVRATNTAAALRNEASAETPWSVFRTSEDDPAQHKMEHRGRHYTIPTTEMKRVFPHGLPPRFQKQIKTFNEACFMVRKPALEIIDCIKNTDFSHPAVRYVIYGTMGTGKSLSLCHVVHYCARQDWLLVHIPDVHILVKNCKELIPSSYRQDRLDQPLEASTWLKSFKTTNERFLKQIVTQQKYVWSKRESTEEGRPLGEVVDQGLTRVKSATDAVGVILKELKRQAPLGSYRMLVSMDGVNSLWGRTSLKKEDRSWVVPRELALVHNLRKMVRNDWIGGAIVMTASVSGALYMPVSAYLPNELLGKEGFEALDPFIPVQVPVYDELEFESCYQYYIERQWLQHEKARTEDGKKELQFLSNWNPGVLEKICAFL